jgi:hypothetical protein
MPDERRADQGPPAGGTSQGPKGPNAPTPSGAQQAGQTGAQQGGQQKAGPKTPNEANQQTGGQQGTKAPALGTDQRPVVAGQGAGDKDPNTNKDNVEKGKLGDGGPSSDAKGENAGNMHAEGEQSPTQNATAGGPDAGQTPANEPGMSHQ